MCSPVQLDVEKPPFKVEARADPPVAVKREGAPSAPPSQGAGAGAGVGRNPVVTVPTPARRAVSGPPTQSPNVKPAMPTPTPTPTAAPSQTPTATQIRVPVPLQSSPLPQPRGSEQLTDSRYGQFICRTGEVVWFFRPKTSAWGLGLVVRRWAAKDSSGGKAYLVQPLSHPLDSATPEVVTSDEHLKPWLAWSAPACTFTYLQQNPQLRYDQVDWSLLLSGQYGQGIADVDASIMAAKAIDGTYTLFERVKTVPIQTGEERHYNGIFLGAEKIWRGDPVRIRLGATGTDLMVMTDIVERVTANPAQTQPPAQPTTQVLITGDIYSYSTLPVPDPSKVPIPPSESNHNIPIRMREDMAWRNRTLVPQTRTLGWWRLLTPASRIEMADIKGRWYETSLLFEESFIKAVKNGEGGNGIWMNARGDATSAGRITGLARPDRVVAFGDALPKGTTLVDGLEPPVATQQQRGPQAPTSDMQGLDIGMGTSGGEAFSLDDFMNVEHLDDGAGVDFGHNFQF